MMRTVATLVSLLPIALVCTLSSGRIFCSQEIDHQNSSIILDIVVSQLKIDFKGNSNMKNKNQHINTPGGEAVLGQKGCWYVRYHSLSEVSLRVAKTRENRIVSIRVANLEKN